MSLTPGEHDCTLTSSRDGTVQPYRLFVPANLADDGAPLVIALHGKGADRHAWFDRTNLTAMAAARGYVAAAPEGRDPSVYGDAGERDVLDVIDAITATGRIDATRVYLVGHSLGGWGTWRIALRHPQRFAAIAPLAGIAPQALLPNALHLAPLIIHDADDEIVPVEKSRRAAQRLTELGIHHCYREEHGYGHSNELISANLPDILDWFEQRRRVIDPGRVTLAFRCADGGQAYWLHVPPQPGVPRGYGRVDARRSADGQWVLTTANVERLVIDRPPCHGGAADPGAVESIVIDHPPAALTIPC